MRKHALTELGMGSESMPRTLEKDAVREAGLADSNGEKNRDYFVERDGDRFAGLHLLVDLWGARYLDDLAAIEKALRAGAKAAKATVLNIQLHQFAPSGGISGVLVLAESHISIHTWPEQGFAAIDIFMCGACDPYRAVPVLRRAFAPKSVHVDEVRRGLGR